MMKEAMAAARSAMALLRQEEKCQAEHSTAPFQAQMDASEYGARRMLAALLEHSAKAVEGTTVAEQLRVVSEQQRKAAVATQQRVTLLEHARVDADGQWCPTACPRNAWSPSPGKWRFRWRRRCPRG